MKPEERAVKPEERQVSADRSGLQVEDLRVGVGETPIVRGVSFTLAPGARLGLVGESGSGKSLTALAVMGLIRPPLRIAGGAVRVGGTDLRTLRRRELDRVRGRRIAMIYQDPAAALNPLMTVGDQIGEVVRRHAGASRSAAVARAVELLGEVGVANARTRHRSYPHEFSGGMLQRVMIAMALAGDPDVLLCDEPTTALDVTTQLRIMNLLDRLCAATGVAALLITHDLGVAAGFCDDIAVMYAGRIVERAATTALYDRPRHPYSRALMSAIIDLDADLGRPVPAIPGQPPAPGELASGCPFRPRCPFAIDACAAAEPDPREIDGHSVRCIRAEEVAV
ncbi:ABC transporter ATP-binding protein [Dactylosporangium sp. NPDC051541]|uniref:ABC transporter ATP-binding protein n=1 Tax=Dactylosporangium sp. NPDC051541 TaxID=3363977 RepID=UPI0037AA4584